MEDMRSNPFDDERELTSDRARAGRPHQTDSVLQQQALAQRHSRLSAKAAHANLDIRWMMRSWFPLIAAALCMVASPEILAAPPRVAEFFENSCLECHDSLVKEGGLDLSVLRFQPSSPENFAKWVLIYDRVRKGDMPPEGNPPLAQTEVKRFSNGVSTALVAAEREMSGSEGRATRRSMNRYEYENMLRDLLAIPVLEIRDFLPEDRIAFGFNKVGDALDVSHVQLARYLSASEFALRQAMAPQAERPEATLQRYYAWDMPGFRKGAGPAIRRTHRIYEMKPQPRRRRRRRGRPPEPVKPVPENVAPHDREQEAVVMVTSTYEPAEIQYNRFRAKVTAKYRLRFSGNSIWISPDFRTVTPGRAPEPVTVYSDRTPGLFRKLFSYDVGPEPTVVEQEVWLIAGETIRPDATRLVRCRPPDFDNPLAEEDGMPGVAWQWMEVEGPIFDEWPPAGQQVLFGDLPIGDVDVAESADDGNETNQRLSAIGLRSFQGPRGVQVISKTPEQDAERFLRRFMQAAYRRPLVEEDVQSFLGVAQRVLENGYSFTEAMLAAYTCVLSSPALLFFDESPGTLSVRALADRLSYFLWNSRPDEELLRRAAEGELHQPDVLRQQTERLLDDPRSSRFVDSFLNYWLDLRLIVQTSPDVELYPEYDLDDLLVESAVDETRLFFADLLKHNLGVSNLVDSDFTYLNNRLAEHYGIPGVDGIEMRRAPLSEDTVRGGILTQASVLKVTANGTPTSTPMSPRCSPAAVSSTVSTLPSTPSSIIRCRTCSSRCCSGWESKRTSLPPRPVRCADWKRSDSPIQRPTSRSLRRSAERLVLTRRHNDPSAAIRKGLDEVLFSWHSVSPWLVSSLRFLNDHGGTEITEYQPSC
jgi:hypothetical protein